MSGKITVEVSTQEYELILKNRRIESLLKESAELSIRTQNCIHVFVYQFEEGITVHYKCSVCDKINRTSNRPKSKL